MLLLECRWSGSKSSRRPTGRSLVPMGWAIAISVAVCRTGVETGSARRRVPLRASQFVSVAVHFFGGAVIDWLFAAVLAPESPDCWRSCRRWIASPTGSVNGGPVTSTYPAMSPPLSCGPRSCPHGMCRTWARRGDRHHDCRPNLADHGVCGCFRPNMSGIESRGATPR